MAHVVSGKIRKAPFVKPGCGQDGQSTMYAIELSEVIKVWNSDEKSYSNYKALFFAKTPGANDFYAKAFAEGSYVTVACEKLKVEQREHDGKVYVSLVMDNPRLEGALPFADQGGNGGQQGGWGQPQQPQQAPQQQAPQQRQQYAQQQAPQQRQAKPQYNEPPMDFDDDIPFGYMGITNRKLLNCI